jgi:HPt (histidine-containing phosphotransfer) domain-containing protein
MMTTDSTIINPDSLSRLDEWGGPKLVKEMIRLFLQNCPDRMDQIRTVVESDDLDQPERGSHSLKSSAANIGAEHLRRIADEIELAASKAELERVRELLPGLEDAFSQATTELEKMVEGMAEGSAE